MKTGRKIFSFLLALALILSLIQLPEGNRVSADPVSSDSSILLQEHFDASSDLWDLGNAQIADGKLTIGTMEETNVAGYAKCTSGSGWTDYTLEFSADFNQNYFRGVYVRSKGISDGYLWWFGATGAQIIKRVGGSWEPIGNLYPTDILWGQHTFRVEVSGSTIKTYVDGMAFNTATDTTFTDGGVIFYTSTGQMTVDDVLVTQRGTYSAAISNQPQRTQLRVAMATADITPDHPVYLQGYDGQGESSLATYPDKFTSDLLARILIVDNGWNRLVFLNLELVFSGGTYGAYNISEQTLDSIAQICNTNRENILLSNTHNHQSYMRLTQLEENKILQAVQETCQRLAPARMGATTVNTQYGVSRGSNYGVDTSAPYDSQMTLIRFDNAQTGEPIGLVYSIPIHNTMLSNGNVENHSLLNCEFTGYASRTIESQMAAQNPNFTAMHINGFYGNAGPYANKQFAVKTVANLKTNGEAFAQEILAGYETIETEAATGSIHTSMTVDSIPTNQYDDSFIQQFGDYEEMPLYITQGAFGDVAFVGVNYEPYSIIGARLRAESPYGTLLLAGDVEGWNGYIPTKEAVAKHNSGTSQVECAPNKSPFDERAEELFYGKVLDSLYDMYGVRPVRISATAQGVSTNGGKAEYTFLLTEETPLDKLVISFGQNARTDCGENFDLLVYDSADQLVYSKTYTGNSTNYLGEFLEGAQAYKVVLRISSRYGKSAFSNWSMSPQVWGIQFYGLGQSLYTEDFSADLTDWTAGTAQITDGKLVLGDFDSSDADAYATCTAGSWSDFQLEFDADLGNNLYRGVSFRNQSDGDEYFWWFGAEGAQLVRRVDGSWDVIGSTHSEAKLSGEHHFKVVAKGGALETYVDGVLYNVAYDTALTAGGIGFYINKNGAWFDNITITALTEPQEAPEEAPRGLPEYTETVSTSTDYANFGGSSWNVTPKTVETTIGAREKYTLALATSYWAGISVSGYSDTPTALTPTFTSGEGLLEFSVRIGAGPIWGGTECELLTITPTDAAYDLTKDTTVTGTIRIYWRGWCDMPFAVTIKANASQNTLRYDDRIAVSAKPVIETVEVQSSDPLTGAQDTAVMTYDAASGQLIATGVGKAKVTVNGITTVYTVEPAPISLFLIVGHSLGQGYGGDGGQSIANTLGQVYATYSADLADQLTTAAGLGLGYGSAKRPAGIDANAAGGGGTKGEGSALSYGWNQLTGEKVWVINTAHGGTNLNTWQPGTADYMHAVEQMGYAQEILSREIQAGHYTFSHMGIVAHTCDNGDDKWETTSYSASFAGMCNGFRTDLAFDADGDGTMEAPEFFALVPSWQNSFMYELESNPFTTAKSHQFTKGRLLNYAYGALADYPDTFVAAAYPRQWLTDAGVEAYFAKSGQPYDTDYPTQNGVALVEPTDRLHGIYGDGVHYNQLGYNAAGLHIAQNIYTYLQDPVAESVTVYDETGLQPLAAGHQLAVGDTLRLAVVAEPICVNDLTLETSGSIQLTDTYTITATASGEGILYVKQGKTVVKTLSFQVTELPAYKVTVSNSTDYASHGGDQWHAEPKLLQLDVGTRETYSLALAGSYWASTANTGYSAEPTRLPVTFTSGDGLLEFYVTLEAGPIWGGVECEMLKIVPTAAAYELSEATVVSGKIDIYWRGYTQIPFSIGLVPTGQDAPDHGEQLPAYTETVSDSTDYASYGGSDWNVTPKTVEATIGAREKYTMALATSYWAGVSVSGYSDTPTVLTPTFTSGEGLLDFSVKIAAGPIWGGAECELLTITPTDAAYALTEDTVVTGTFRIYWRGWCDMPFSITVTAPKPAAPEPVGMRFASDDFYWVDKPYEEAIYTFETHILMPQSLDTRAGALLNTSGAPGIAFEIAEYGIPRMNVYLADGTTVYYSFNSVRLQANKWLHLAFVRDEAAGKMHCYVDGVLKESLSLNQSDPTGVEPIQAFRFGTHHYSSMDLNFKGKIASMTLYSDARTAEELKQDMETVSQENLIAHYVTADFAAGTTDHIEDLSGNGYDIYSAWQEEAPQIGDYSYSFAVVGDTQIITEEHPEYLQNIYNWIVDNAEEKNTKFVLGLGDITNKDTDTEWKAAIQNIQKMDSVVPYSLVRGNHDSVNQFNQYVNYDTYTQLLGGTYDASLCNTWQELQVGDMSYLIMTLDYCPKDAVLEWAGQVIADHPHHNVIITTHGYMNPDGSLLSDMQFGGSNNGQQVWEKLLSQYENIVLVISGHEPSDTVVVKRTEGVNGNVVTQMLVDPQNIDAYTIPTGMVTMLYFSEDGKNVQVETYSTIQEKWYLRANQFSLTLNTVEPAETLVDMITNSTATLESMLQMDFIVNTSELTGNDNYVMLTRTYADGREPVQVRVDQKDWKYYGVNQYTASYTQIAAKEMGDTVTAVVFNGKGQQLSNPRSDSIKAYAYRGLKSLESTSLKKYKALRTLLVDMLNYGAAAQVQFGYNTGNLVNADMTAAQKAWGTQSDVTVTSNRVLGTGAYTTTLSLESAVCIDFHFKTATLGSTAAKWEKLYAVITYKDHYGKAQTVRVPGTEFVKSSYGVQVSATTLAAADVRGLVTCTVYNASDVEIASCTDSMEGYMARALASGQAGQVLENLCRAMAKYMTSANTYFHM